MGNLKVTIEHGSGLGSILNVKTVLIGAAALVIVACGGLGGVESGLTSLLEWLAGVLVAVVAVVTYFMIRAMRRGTGKNYVRSMHGPTQHEVVLNELAATRQQLADIRAMRRQVEAARALGIPYAPGFMRFVPQEEWPAAETWTAEVIDG